MRVSGVQMVLALLRLPVIGWHLGVLAHLVIWRA